MLTIKTLNNYKYKWISGRHIARGVLDAIIYFYNIEQQTKQSKAKRNKAIITCTLNIYNNIGCILLLNDYL